MAWHFAIAFAFRECFENHLCFLATLSHKKSYLIKFLYFMQLDSRDSVLFKTHSKLNNRKKEVKMSTLVCPKCSGTYGYFDGINNVCPECAHEWNENSVNDDVSKVLDAHGNELSDGDTVTLIKALKLKGSKDSLKQGTKVKNIRLVPDGDHNIDCKIDGVPMMLKSEFVKKS